MARSMIRLFSAATVPVCAALCLASCASTGQPAQVAYTPTELRAEAERRVMNARPGEIIVPYQVTPELVEQAHDLTRYIRSEYDAARALIDAVTNENIFGIEYMATATAPADETVIRGYGNCLALTSVFIGLARGVGLEVYYIDASDRVNDIRREEQIIVDSGHIAAVTRTERGWTMVDFAGELPNYRTFRIIDDLTVLAHYYNNRGYEIIDIANQTGQEVPWDQVRRSFDIATKVRPDFSLALNNLGVLDAQAGNNEAAERAYHAAITADSEFAAPYHNLGNLKLSEGDLDSALAAYDEAIRIRRKNPFLHYHRGLALYRMGDLDEAVRAFDRAISLKRDYVEPRNILAQAYDKLGRPEDAARVRKSVRNLLSQHQ
jgi:tetratricopeptide (TPR) repeat protein